jgi:citrate synthase
VLSGLGAVSGLLHGAAGHAPYQMLDDARTLGSPELAVARALGRRDRATVNDVITAASATAKTAPNIDMATAALAFTMQMSASATEAIFDIARTVGWIAHAIEEYGEAPLRFRARALYSGPATVAPAAP